MILGRLPPKLATFAYSIGIMKFKHWFCLGTCTLVANQLLAQCSICTKTATQLGEGPAASLNSAIIYLAIAPFAIVGYFGWRWWKNEKKVIEEESV